MAGEIAVFCLSNSLAHTQDLISVNAEWTVHSSISLACQLFYISLNHYNRASQCSQKSLFYYLSWKNKKSRGQILPGNKRRVKKSKSQTVVS